MLLISFSQCFQSLTSDTKFSAIYHLLVYVNVTSELDSSDHEICQSNAKDWFISGFMLCLKFLISDGLGLTHLQTGNINELKVRQFICESLQCAFLYRQIMVERKGHHHWFWKGLKIGASHLSNQREGGTTELCYAAGKSQMAISDPYQSAKWLKVHLAKWRLASSIIHDALFSLLQGIHCTVRPSSMYIQLV